MTTKTSLSDASRDYARIERAIRFLDDDFRDQPSLERVAAAAGLSEYHFHRLFSRWVGVTPKRFLQYLTAEYAKERLEESRSVLDVAWDAGLSGSGRLHDLMVVTEALTPGEYKHRGRGLEIRYGAHPSPFGGCVVAVTSRGVCGLEFLAGRRIAELRGELESRWPEATFRKDPEETATVLPRLFPDPGRESEGPLTLHVRGTNFQVQVWQALLRIPSGCLTSYGEIARAIGRPGSSRAVGGAVGSNPISWIIPCHRVIRSTGGFGNYRWGTARKKAMLAFEASGARSAAE